MERLLLTFCILASLSTTGSASEYWRLTKDQAECLVANVDGYLSSGQEVLMIVAAGCPEPDPSKALALATRNSTLPTLQVVPNVEETDSIVVYNSAELRCLKEATLDLSGLIVLLPKDPAC